MAETLCSVNMFMFTVIARYRPCIYDEGIVLHEVTEIPWHVRFPIFHVLDLTLTQPSSPGFFSRLKEKGALAKDVWGVIGSA